MNAVPFKTFKFKGMIPGLVVIIFLMVVCIFLVILTLRQGKSLGEAVFFSCDLIILLWVAYAFLIGKSNVIISSDSISKTIFGKKIREISWKNVQKIKVFPIKIINSRKNTTGYNIISSSDMMKYHRIKKIYFTDDTNDLSDLVEILNFYVDRYNIDIELVSNGTKAIVKSIPQ